MDISPKPISDSFVKAKIEDIDMKIQIGLEQAKAGLSVPMDQKLIEDLLQELEKRIVARQKKR